MFGTVWLALCSCGWNFVFFLRQTLKLVGKDAGPFEVAGKDVAGVIKSIDENLAAVGVVPEKQKTQCKGCPSVRRSSFSQDTFLLIHRHGLIFKYSKLSSVCSQTL